MNECYVYILANGARTLYIGIADNLQRQVQHHRTGNFEYTARNKITRLVHFEGVHSSLAAAEREKEIRGWGQVRRIALIEQYNAAWNDLAEKW